MQISNYEAKLLNLKLKTWPKQLLGFLQMDVALPYQTQKAFVSIKFQKR
jgi:hypothetical protein